MANYLTKAYKLKVLKFILDEDPLKCQIYFLDFMESLEMIFSWYKETCEVLLYCSTIQGEDIKDYGKNSISNLLDNNIYVHSRRLIAEFPVDGVKFISNIQYHCANMNFSEKGRYDGIF